MNSCFKCFYSEEKKQNDYTAEAFCCFQTIQKRLTETIVEVKKKKRTNQQKQIKTYEKWHVRCVCTL